MEPRSNDPGPFKGTRSSDRCMKNRDWIDTKCDSGKGKVGPELLTDGRDTKQTGQG